MNRPARLIILTSGIAIVAGACVAGSIVANAATLGVVTVSSTADPSGTTVTVTLTGVLPDAAVQPRPVPGAPAGALRVFAAPAPAAAATAATAAPAADPTISVTAVLRSPAAATAVPTRRAVAVPRPAVTDAAALRPACDGAHDPLAATNSAPRTAPTRSVAVQTRSRFAGPAPAARPPQRPGVRFGGGFRAPSNRDGSSRVFSGFRR